MTVTTTYLAMFAPDQLRPRYIEDKRPWTDEQWRARTETPGLLTFRALWGGETVGYFELRDDGQGGIEIEYFGLLPGHYGRGLGGALLTRALEEAWRLCPDRVWLHTCTLDHPAALPNYEARGLRIYRTGTDGTGPQGSRPSA